MLQRSVPPPPLPLSLPVSFHSLPLLFFPLEVGSLRSSWGCERCKLPQRGLGGTPAEIEFGAFYVQTVTSGGNNFNHFPETVPTREITTKKIENTFLVFTARCYASAVLYHGPVSVCVSVCHKSEFY